MEANVSSTSHADEVDVEIEPGSRIFTEADMRSSSGNRLKGWMEAVRKEYQESFLDMHAVTGATPEEIAQVGVG